MPVRNAKSADDRERGRQRDERIADAMRREDADGIGAEAEEGGVAERDQRAVADQEIERDRGDGEDHHPRHQAEQIARHPPTARPAGSSREHQEDADRQRLEPRLVVSALWRRAAKRKRRRLISAPLRREQAGWPDIEHDRHQQVDQHRGDAPDRRCARARAP